MAIAAGVWLRQAASLHTPASTTPKRQTTLATAENRTHSRTTLAIIHLSRPHWTKRPLPPPPPVCRVLAAAPAQLRPPPEQLPPAVMLRSAARGLRVAVLRTPSTAPAKWVSPPLLILIPFPSSAWSSLILHLAINAAVAAAVGGGDIGLLRCSFDCRQHVLTAASHPSPPPSAVRSVIQARFYALKLPTKRAP